MKPTFFNRTDSLFKLLNTDICESNLISEELDRRQVHL